MLGAWDKLREVALRNRPRQKPQLWEDFFLALRRRVEFEVGRRMHDDWLDRGHVVELSRIGFPRDAEALQIEVVPREMMNRAMFLYGASEISETRLVQAVLSPGMTFIDVGANIGYYTLVAARMVGDTGVVHAFEPNGKVRERLEANVRRNGLRNVTVHPEAVGEAVGEVEFFVSTWQANSGISSLLPGPGREEKRRVPSTSIDALAASLGSRRIDLIKIDIEGAEPLAIAGGRRTLGASDGPTLIFEADDVRSIGESLRPLGYEIRRLHYTLESGLELLDAEAPFDNLFAAYEAPNYLAAKSDEVFERALDRANATRSPLLRLLGRV